jgi:DNA-binding NtrC family response regulator
MILAAVRDLFFVARIRETARLAGSDVAFARGPEEVAGAPGDEAPGLIIVDLTTPGWDYDAIFAAVEGRAPRIPVLGFTTHALARQTARWHPRCSRVVTKETLSQELGDVLRNGTVDGRPATTGRAPSPALPRSPGG